MDYQLGNIAGRLDRWSNPVPGPNAGRNLLEQRILFLTSIESLLSGLHPIDETGLDNHLRSIEKRAGSLLEEPPYRAVVGLRGGLAYARIGRPQKARAELEQAYEMAPYEDLALNLANFEAITGDLDAASSRLHDLINNPATPKASYDAPLLLLSVAIQQRDIEVVKRAVAFLSIRGFDHQVQADMTEALWVRPHLWMDALGEADCRARSLSLLPAGAAHAALARWRLGRTKADDVEQMTRLIELNPDAVFDGTLALGAVHLGLGQPREALAVLDPLMGRLEVAAREDFTSLQLLQLARALRVRALADAGERQRALHEGQEALGEMKPGLLPAVLVREVLVTPS